MPSSSQMYETLNIRALRSLVDQEISNGIQYIKQSAANQMSLSETVSAMVLGLDVQVLALYYSEEKRQEMIELAKTTPILLTYATGKERQGALQAVWELQNRAKDVSDPIVRAFYEQPTTIQKHFLTTKVKELPIGPLGLANVEYIPCDVVPLIDYWPNFVRTAFALGCWRFTEGCNGVFLEIMEGRLDLIEWLIEMEEKRKSVMKDSAARSQDKTTGGIWPILSTIPGFEKMHSKEKSKEHVLMEAAQMIKGLNI